MSSDIYNVINTKRLKNKAAIISLYLNDMADESEPVVEVVELDDPQAE